MSVRERLHTALRGEPRLYTRAWLTSINVVGGIVVAAVLFDIGVVLGEGQTGIFRRALYPLVPPAVTLGVAVASSDRRDMLLSGAALAGYTLLLASVGTLGDALANGPGYVIGGAAGVGALLAVGWLYGRSQSEKRSERSSV